MIGQTYLMFVWTDQGQNGSSLDEFKIHVDSTIFFTSRIFYLDLVI